MANASWRISQRICSPGDLNVRGNQNSDTHEPVGKNPPNGAIFDYWLARDAHAPVTLDILDASGKLVRRFASNAATPKLASERYFEARWLQPPARLSTQAGAHRFVWNLRLPRPLAAGYDYSIAAIDGEDTPLLPQGMLVAPGHYQPCCMSMDTTIARHSVQADPRVAVDSAAVQDASL